jgi:signal peptidase II
VSNRLARLRQYLPLVAISGIILILDQGTKALVRSNLEVGEEWFPLPDIFSFVRILHWRNTGAAFGIFPQAGLVFTLIAVFVSFAIVYYWSHVPRHQKLVQVALAMQLGGALGNLSSRLLQGEVTDIFAVGNFPVFNIADSSISIGVAILILATWREERREKNERDADQIPEQDHEDHSAEVDLSM